MEILANAVWVLLIKRCNESDMIELPFIPDLSIHMDWAFLDTSAVRNLPPLVMRQAWLDRPESDFQGGKVRVFRGEDCLGVFAHLVNTSPCNGSRGYNALHFLEGDVFEVFIQPQGESRYWEIHVTPEGETYQVCIPNREEFQKRRTMGLPISELVKPYLLAIPLANCGARILPSNLGWEAFILFPLPVEPVGDWKISACTCSRKGKGAKPTLVSVAPLSRPDFHRLDEWVVFRFPKT